MTTINGLNKIGTIDTADLVPLWDTENNATRKATLDELMTFIKSQLAASGNVTTSGFADYNDTATAVSPIALSAGVWTTLTNNTLGANTNTTYLPSGVTSLYDKATNKIKLSGLKLGDVVHIRPDFVVTPSTNNQLLQMRFFIGNTGQEYSLTKYFPRLDSGGGASHNFSMDTYMVYIGNTNTLSGGLKIQLNLSGSGTVVNKGFAISVVRR